MRLVGVILTCPPIRGLSLGREKSLETKLYFLFDLHSREVRSILLDFSDEKRLIFQELAKLKVFKFVYFKLYDVNIL